jgi:hypothetical protein
MSLTSALVLKRSGVSLFVLWTFFACGGRDNAEVYSNDGGLLTCGNGQLDPEEDCDGEAMGEIKTCADAMIPGATGSLRCAKNCTLDTSACRSPSSGTGGRGGSAGMMSNGGTTGLGGRTGRGGFGGTSFGGQNGGGTTGFGGRNNGGQGGTMGMGGRGRGRGNGGTPQAGGSPSAGGNAPTDAGVDSGPVVDAGPSCVGSADCGSGQVCCGTISGGQYTGFTCEANCGASDTVVDCSKPSDCGNGQVCCGAQQVNGGTRQYTSLSCQATCVQTQNEYVLCVANSDCSNGLTCQGSAFLPPQFRVCR